MSELTVHNGSPAIYDAGPTLLNSEIGPSSISAWAQAASDAARLVGPLVQTDFVPQHFRGQVAAATAAVLYGAEAGLSPLQALQGVYVISGKPAMYARTLLAVTLAQGHEVWTEELTDSRAIVCGRRRGSQRVEKVTWTIERARKAGYTKNAKYQSDPQSMLLARAQSDVCRRIAPDALLGMAYSVEELEDEAPTETTEPPKAAKRTARRAPLAPVPEPALDEAAPAEPQDNSDPRDVPATKEQVTKLNIQLQEAGITDRDEKLMYLSGSVGREITSSKDLTKAEAHSLIDALEREQEAEKATDQGDDTPYGDEPPL